MALTLPPLLIFIISTCGLFLVTSGIGEVVPILGRVPPFLWGIAPVLACLSSSGLLCQIDSIPRYNPTWAPYSFLLVPLIVSSECFNLPYYKGG